MKGVSADEKQAITLMRFHTLNPTSDAPVFLTLKKISAALRIKYSRVQTVCKRIITQWKPTIR